MQALKITNNFINKILTIILGNPGKFSFEDRLILANVLFASFVSLASAFVNFKLNLGLPTIVITALGFVLYLVIFVLGRIFYKIIFVKWFFSFYTLFLCNFLWATNYGSKGSTLFLFLVYYFIMVFALDSIKIKWVTFLVLLNITILFYLETHFINLIPDYPNDIVRISDSYYTFMIVLGFFYIITVNAKNNYIKQYKRAQESDKLKSAFLANMSHEIRTPLNSILGFSRLLTKGELPKDKKEKYAQLINDNGNYLLKVISDILDVSLIETGQIKIHAELVDVSKLCHKLYDIHLQMLREAGKSKVKLKLQLPEQPVSIISDAVRVEQVLSNFLNNAVKFTTEGHIILGYKTENDKIVFFVEDTGRGIKDEYKNNLFNRFVKNEDKTEKHFDQGAGIGLSLCRELSRLLHGEVWFSSVYQQGSVFYFSLPFNK